MSEDFKEVVRTPLSRRAVLLGSVASTATIISAKTALAPLAQAANANDFARVRDQWRSTLVGQYNANDSTIRSYLNESAQQAQQFWSTMNKSGNRSYLWADLDSSRTSAVQRNNIGRLRTMALALCSPGSPLYDNITLRNDILSAVDWFISNKYGPTNSYDNWWDWQIGIPLALNDVCILLYANLSSSLRTRAMNAVARYAPNPRETGNQLSTGANRNWACAVAIVRGALINSDAVISNAKNAVADIFPYTTSRDGFYTDGGYVQHIRYSYNGGYGVSLLQYLTYSMIACQNTPWAFTGSRLDTVYTWIRKHYAPWIYAGGFMDMTRGRGLSRFYETDHRTGRLVIATLLQLAKVLPANQAKEVRSLCKGWIQTNSFLPFFKYDAAPIEQVRISSIAAGLDLMGDVSVPAKTETALTMSATSMARAVHRRPRFAVGLAMDTTDIRSYESVNRENRRGWYTGEGALYMYLPGKAGHYPNQYWPTANMYRIPGTTVDTRKLSDAVGRYSENWWAGGAVLGSDAAFGMSLKFPTQSLVGRKSYFCNGDHIICLGAGISSNDGNRIETIIEQRNIGPNGKTVPVINNNEELASVSSTAKNFKAYWAWIPETCGYVFPGTANIKALREDRSGRWTDIDTRGVYDDNTLYTRRYISFWFDHGINPTNATYSYIQAPGAGREETRQLAINPDLNIVANNNKVQAIVRPEHHVIMANFWTADAPKTAGIEASDRCSVVLTRNGQDLKISVSDPTRRLNSVIITLDRVASSVGAVDSGVQVLATNPKIKFRVDLAAHDGRSFIARFKQA